MDARNEAPLVIEPTNPETESEFDGAVSVWDPWLVRLYVDTLAALHRSSLN